MRADTAELYLRCCRPENGRPGDPKFSKAMKTAMADPRLRPLAEDQTAFDQWAMDRVGEIEVPEETLKELADALSTRSSVPSWRSPAVLSVLLGLILIAGVAGYFWMEEMAAFDGRASAEEMVERTGRMRESDMQAVTMKLGDLDDWLFMQNVDFLQVPPNLQHLTAVGARVFQHEGSSVVQLAIKEHDLVVMIFRPEDFGVRLPSNGDWKIFPVDDWVGAIRLSGEHAILLAMRGNRTDMRDTINTIESAD